MLQRALIPALCLFALTARGLVVEKASVDQQLAAAPLVADIEVKSIESATDTKDKILTRAKARVTSVIRFRDDGRRVPATGDDIVIVTPGGEVNGVGMMIAGLPRPHTGHRYRAYLTRQDNDTYAITGFEHGLVGADGSRGFSRNRTDGSNGEGSGPFLFWDDSYFPIPYFVSATTFAGLPNFIPAIDASLNTWRNVGGTKFDFLAMGCSTAVKNENDGINNVVFITRDWPFDSAAIAITRNFYVSGSSSKSGMILDSDILLNSVNHSFTTTNEPGKHDIQNIVTHEAGHFLGLGHEQGPSPDADATMYAVASPNEFKKRTLHADDRAGILAAYAGAGNKFSAGPTTATCTIPPATPACGAVHHRDTEAPPEMGWALAYLIFLMMVGRLVQQRRQ